MKKPRQSPSRAALYWSSQITTLSFEVAFFCLLGYWGDQRWGTRPWLLLAGGSFGLLVSGWHLWQMVRAMERADRDKRKGRR